MPNTPKLYALLAAVDAYRYPVRPLNGCVNDIMRFKQYLETAESRNFQLQIEVLANEKATKGNIVKLFEDHLAKAGPEDIALFYYAGHGAQEKADPAIWRFEPDGKLEGLVCYDSIPSTGQNFNLLVDKELRFMIHRLAHGTPQRPRQDPPHVVMIFDCCHSGGNTRNVYIGKESRSVSERRFKPMPAQPGQPRMGAILPPRKWDQFLFARDIKLADLKSKPLPEVMPEGRHVQLAACQSDESAYEAGGSGVFSRNLVDVLQRSGGSISYFDLKNRLRYFIKNQFQQSPQIFGGGGPETAGDLYKGFLNKTSGTNPLYGNVVYNPKSGWVMDLGAMHGVSTQATAVKVIPAGKTSPVFEAQIKSVAASETLLQFDAATESKLSKDKELYQGYIDGFLSAPIRLYISDVDKEESAARQLKDILVKQGKNLSVAQKEREADYAIQLMNGCFSITRPGDAYRPLVYPQKGYTPKALAQTLADLQHIAQWEYVKNLNNDGPNRLPLDAVAVEFFKVQPDGKEVPIAITADEVRTAFDPGNFDGRPYGGNIRIRVSNRSAFPVFVSLLYLSNTFEVFGELITGKVQKLEPLSAGGAAWVFDGGNVGLLYEPSVEYFNHPESVSYFKLIASKQEFSVDTLEQAALADPALLVTRTRGGERGITRPANNADADAWTTRLFTLHLPNPRFNKIGKAEVQTWFKTEAGPWMKGIYK